MKTEEFNKLRNKHGIEWSDSVYAARFHLVDGDTQAEAARQYGINPSSVSRMVKRLLSELPKCPTCGQVIKPKMGRPVKEA